MAKSYILDPIYGGNRNMIPWELASLVRARCDYSAACGPNSELLEILDPERVERGDALFCR